MIHRSEEEELKEDEVQLDFAAFQNLLAVTGYAKDPGH